MGGFLSGLAAATGGAAAPLERSNEQIRGLLESRRMHFADALLTLAQQEPDPQRRSEYIGHASDLYSGKDMGKILPAFIKTAQNHHAANEALAQAIGSPQQPTKQVATPTPPGQVPGTATAAQPSTSPAQGGPLNITEGLKAEAPPPQPAPSIPSIQAALQAPPQPQVQAPQDVMITPPGMPQAQTVADIYRKYQGFPEFATPAGFVRLKPLMDQEIAHNEALRQEQEKLRTALAYKRAQIAQMKQNGLWDKLQPWQQAAYEAEGGGLSPVNMPGFAMTPKLISPRINGEDAPPGTLVYGTRQIPEKGKQYRVEMTPMTGETFAYPLAPETVVSQTPGGGMQLNNRTTGAQIGPVAGAVAPSWNAPNIRGVDQNGNFDVTSAARLNAGVPPVNTGLMPPSMLPTVHTNEAINPVTGEVTQTHGESRKTAPGPRAQGVQPVSTGGSSGHALNGSNFGTVSTHDAEGHLLGTPAFKTLVNNAVSNMLTPNMSNAQLEELRKGLGPEKSPLRRAVENELIFRRGQDAGPLSWDITESERAHFSTQALTHIKDMEALITKLEASGQLGPVMGRWNEFWSGKIGSDLTQNQDYIKLADNANLLNKALGRIHGGARGGGSIQMAESLGKMLGVDRMDPGTLRSALSVEKNWLETYANPASSTKPQGSDGGAYGRLKEKYLGGH